MQAGYCTHPGKVANPRSSWKSIVFPASVAVIEHSLHGVLLYDSGYSEHFYNETRRWPNSVYGRVTPVFIDEGTTAKAQLESRGISPRDVRHIVLSHFHGDHIAGVRDFSKAQFIYQEEAFTAVRHLKGISALRKAFLPGLLPQDFEERGCGLNAAQFSSGPKELSQFEGVHDVFGDGSVWAVPMPGHTEGHLGLLVRTQDKDYLLAGDACYVRDNFIFNQPSSVITKLIMDDFSAYKETLHRLHQTHIHHPRLQIVPCHCHETLKELPHFEGERAQINL